jgi:hypothetical protein
MVDNFVFEIDNHGAVLNSNRAYYFTRSHLGFLARWGGPFMKRRKQRVRTTGHGSRRPAEEALPDENDVYRRVAAYFLLHPTLPRIRKRSPVTSAIGGTAARTPGNQYHRKKQ